MPVEIGVNLVWSVAASLITLYVLVYITCTLSLCTTSCVVVVPALRYIR